MLEGSPSSVLTLGLGAWGSTSLIVTSGFGVGEAATVVPPQYFIPLLGATELRPELKGIRGYHAPLISTQNVNVRLKGER